MKILCLFGRYNYGDPARGEGYEYCNFIPALKALGHEIELFDSFSRSEFNSFGEMNLALIHKVNSFRPQVLFCVLIGYEIWLETFRIIRDSGVRVVHWGTDDSWKYPQFSRLIAPSFDLWVTTAQNAMDAASRDGLDNFHLSQWASGVTSLAEPLSSADCRYDVSFIGSAYGNRPGWISALRERGIEVTCFGHGWANGPVTIDDVRMIIRESRLSLNFGDSGVQFRGMMPYRSRQIKARIFEVPGAGGCLLTEPAEYLERYYTIGSELEIFTSYDNLAGKVRQLLTDPARRDAMARAGYLRTEKEHTYEARFEEILRQISPVSTTSLCSLEDFKQIALKHETGSFSRLLRSLYVAPFRLIWGPRRGSRAARRLLFELSWRLAGVKTYSVSGLPGRLFYDES